ncbi:MAG: hypothetical protein HN368_17385, partial [Spirochaetales bacterium]|nr:hypothetical protein [Spirochaetales bacterium]
MKTAIPRRYYLIPVAYIVIIAALLAFEFTGTVRIEEQLKDLTVAAVLPARQNGNGQSVQSI